MAGGAEAIRALVTQVPQVFERILEGERSAYAAAAERLEEMHEELGRVVAERDKIRDVEESIGVPMEQFIGISISGLQEVAADIGLGEAAQGAGGA